MPAVSEAQFRAMQAAKHGESTLGIPPAVGAEFVAAGKPSHLPAKKAKKAKIEDEVKAKRLHGLARRMR